MKVAIPVIQNPHKEGEYPVHYSGFKVGIAKVINNGQNVLLELNLETNDPDQKPIFAKLAEKLTNKKASVSSVGAVQYDVINSQDMLEATLEGFVINDLPEYTPHEGGGKAE